MLHFIFACIFFYCLYKLIFKLGEWTVLAAVATSVLSFDLFKWLAHLVIGTPEENSK
jgi:hypothetical protein